MKAHSLECLRCGHRWIPRLVEANGSIREPLTCPSPSCGSKRWNKPILPGEPGRKPQLHREEIDAVTTPTGESR